MADGKKTILVYADWINIFEELEEAEAGRLIQHFFRYVNDKNPEAPDRLTRLLFEPIKATLKRDLKRYEEKSNKNRENVNTRWNKKDTNVYERIKDDTNHTDTDTDTDTDTVKDKKEKTIGVDFKKLAEFYNSTLCPPLSKVTIPLSGPRKAAVHSREKEHGKDSILDMLSKAKDSPFIMGDNDSGWKANFDWLFNPKNFLKVIEGNYLKQKKNETTTAAPYHRPIKFTEG